MEGNKEMKVEILGEAEAGLPTEALGLGTGGLARQGSINKNMSCLCSPTTHAGSFRCRLHRAPPGLQRTKSVDSNAALDSHSPKPNEPAQMVNHDGTLGDKH